MALIQWIIGTTGLAERLVGSGSATFLDVLNRPLRQVLAASGLDPDAAFTGFALAGASGSISSSYALTSSYALNGGSGGSGVSSSYALTASFATKSATASLATSASYATIAQNVLGSIVSASFAATASIATVAITALTANAATLAGFATSADSALSSSYALDSSNSINADSASLAISSSFSTTASFALSILRTPVKTVSASYTASADDSIILVNATGATASILLPSVSGNSGDSIFISKRDSGSFPVNIFSSGSDTIDGFSAVTLTTRYSSVVVTSNGLTHWMSGGSSSFNGTPVSSSYALSCSYAANGAGVPSVSASYSLTASYALNGGSGGASVSSSYAATASVVSRLTVVLVTGSYSASSADAFIVVSAQNGSASVYLPPALNISGQSIGVRKSDSSPNPVIVDAAGADTVDGDPGRQFIVQGDSAVFIADGGSQWLSDGQLVEFSFISSSFAITSSFAKSGSFATSASFATTSSYAKLAQNVLGSIVSASYALTASYALNGGSGGGGSGINPSLTLGIPNAAASGALNLFAFNLGTEPRPSWVDCSGSQWSVAKHPGRTQISYMFVNPNTGIMFDDVGSTIPSGVPSYIAATAASLKSSYETAVYATGTGPGTYAGWAQARQTAQGTWGSYAVSVTFCLPSWHTDGKLFVGMINTSTMAVSSSINGLTFDPSTKAIGNHLIGLTKDSADTNAQLATCDGVTFNKRDTGVVLSQNIMYRLTISNNANDAHMGFLWEDLTNGVTLFDSAPTLNRPAVGSMLGFQAGVGSGGINSNSLGFAYGVLEKTR